MKRRNREKKEQKDYSLLIMSIPIVLSLLIVIGTFAYHIPIETKKTLENKERENLIYSLKSGTGTSGMFILGTGLVNTEEYYFFFQKDSVHNGYVKMKVPTRSTLIVETDSIPKSLHNYPEIKTYRQYIIKDDAVDTEHSTYGLFYSVPDFVKYEYKLYVPKGTITENVSWNAL